MSHGGSMRHAGPRFPGTSRGPAPCTRTTRVAVYERPCPKGEPPMKASYRYFGILLLLASPAFAQSSTTTRETTVYTPGEKTVTYTGVVTEYNPKKTIVIRDTDKKLVTYTLAPDVILPEDVKVGQSVTIYAEPLGGNSVVKKVTTSVTPEGDLKTTTRTTETTPGGTSTTTEETTVEGTVSAYVPSKTVTLKRTDGTSVTYYFQGDAVVPSDLVVGKQVVLRV